MKRKLTSLMILLLLGLFLAGCTAREANGAAGGDVVAGSPGGTTAPQSGDAATTYASAQALNLSGSKTQTISTGGYYTISGKLTNAQLIVDTEGAVYLELAGVDITNNSGPALQITNAKQVTITLRSGTSNSLSDGGSSEFNAALFSNDSLLIEGEGSLTIKGNNEHGIESDDDITINGGNLSIAAKTDGLHANDAITVNGGVLEVTEAYEGIEGKGEVIINGGTVTVSATDDGINAGTGIRISGGSVFASCSKGDAIDSNGTISIAGGTIVAIGGSVPEGGIDCDRNEMIITGGTLVAAGGTNSTPSTNSTQPVVLLAGTAADSLLHIQGDAEVLTFLAGRSYQSLVFSSPLLAQGESYTVYTGGTVSDGSNFHGLYTDSTYSGGTEGDSFTIASMVTIQGGNTGMGGPGGMGAPGGTRPTKGW